ncbi:MAG: hypothetical protein ACR2QK_15105 [Acidimicrobiales bacterium]
MEPIRVVMALADPITDRELQALQEAGVEVGRLVFDPTDLAEAIQELQPDVVVIDTALDGNTGFEAIEQTRYRSMRVGLLARTPSPPDHDTVARALARGAAGYIDVDAEASTVRRAVETIAAGDHYLPVGTTYSVLAEAGADLGLTAAQRDSRLRNLVFGLIPLAGGLAALMSLLWRRYVGHIGVRPVDLAIDPATRLVDALFAVSVLLAIVGPVLFIGSWLDLLAARSDRRVIGWLAGHRRVSRLAFTFAILILGSVFVFFSQVILALFVGPLIAGLLLAKAFDLDDDLPAVLRLDRWESGRATLVAVGIPAAILALLSFEVLVVGPDLRPDGAHGWLAPSVLGFRAQPMKATSVQDGQQRDALYLGGNADLYVLVDPCDDDRVEFVSVGSTRLQVIDTVTC